MIGPMQRHDEQVDARALTEELVDPELERVCQALTRIEVLRTRRAPS